MSRYEWKAQVTEGSTWAFAVDRLDDTTYALYQGRDLSLIDEEGLKQFLRQHLGGPNEHTLGGGHVG